MRQIFLWIFLAVSFSVSGTEKNVLDLDFTGGVSAPYKLLGDASLRGKNQTFLTPSPDGRSVSLYGGTVLFPGKKPGSKGAQVLKKVSLPEKGIRVTAVFRLEKDPGKKSPAYMVLLDNRGMTDIPRKHKIANPHKGLTFALTTHSGNRNAFRVSAWVGHGKDTDKMESIWDRSVLRDGSINTVSFAYDGKKHYTVTVNENRIWYGEAKKGGSLVQGTLPLTVGALSRSGAMALEGEILKVQIFSDPDM